MAPQDPRVEINGSRNRACGFRGNDAPMGGQTYDIEPLRRNAGREPRCGWSRDIAALRTVYPHVSHSRVLLCAPRTTPIKIVEIDSDIG